MVHQTNQNMCYTNLLRTNREKAAHNTDLAKLAVQYSASTFVVKIATFAKPETVSSNFYSHRKNKK